MQSTKTSSAGQFFDNWKIKTKLRGGFGVLLTLFVGASILGYINFVIVAKDVEKFSVYVEEAAIIAHVEVDFLKLNSKARDYIRTGDPADAKAAKSYFPKIVAQLAKAKKLITDKKHLEEIAVIEAALAKFKKDFAQAELLETEFLELRNQKLAPLGEKVIKDLDLIMKKAVSTDNQEAIIRTASAREHAFLILVYTGRLLDQHLSEFGKKVSEEFAALEKTMAGLGQVLTDENSKALHKEAVDLFHEYEKVFDKTYADEKQLKKLIDGDLAQSALKLTMQAETLQKELSALELEIKKVTLSEIELAEIELVVIAVIGLVIGLVMTWLLGNGISNPIISMTEAMRRLAANDLSAEVPGLNRGDEIGEMADAVQIFKDNGIERERLEEQQKEEQRLHHERSQKVMALTTNFDQSVSERLEIVANAATELTAMAQAMSSDVDDTRAQTTIVSSAIEESAQALQTVSSATEELESSILEITRQMEVSMGTVSSVAKHATATSEQVQGLIDVANQVGNVVALINDIAEQTNLLALNATIEAARAGDAGKGFAVVASEVKNLASQTSNATGDIAAQISSIQAATGDAAQAITSITSQIQEVEEVSSAVASAVTQQQAATQEIARNVDETASGTHEIVSSVTKVTGSAENTGAAATQVLAAAEDLATQAESLRTVVGTFLDDVRAA